MASDKEWKDALADIHERYSDMYGDERAIKTQLLNAIEFLSTVGIVSMKPQSKVFYYEKEII